MSKPICQHFTSKNDNTAGCCNCANQITQLCLEYLEAVERERVADLLEVFRRR